MNVIIRELKANVKSFIIWASAILIFMGMVMVEFSAYAGNEEMLSIIEAMPKQVLDAFKFSSFDLTTVTGFYGIMFTYFTLMLAIYAMLLGNGIISKEEKDKTVEFAMVLPITRRKLMTGKLITAVIYSFLLTAGTYLMALIFAAPYLPEVNFHQFLLLITIGTFIIQLVFLSIGFLLGCTMKRYKKSGYFGVSVILITFLMTMLIELSSKLDFLRYLSPFMYFDTILIKNKLVLEGKYLLLSFCIVSVSIIAGYIAYQKRDLYI